jgi:hypothetical protein
VTPLQMDLTHHSEMARVAKWLAAEVQGAAA